MREQAELLVFSFLFFGRATPYRVDRPFRGKGRLTLHRGRRSEKPRPKAGGGRASRPTDRIPPGLRPGTDGKNLPTAATGDGNLRRPGRQPTAAVESRDSGGGTPPPDATGRDRPESGGSGGLTERRRRRGRSNSGGGLENQLFIDEQLIIKSYSYGYQGQPRRASSGNPGMLWAA